MNRIIINDKEYNVIYAITEEEQRTGLMWIKKPGPIMAFPFIEAKPTQFWMKNTFIPLDIVFCKQGEIIYYCKGEPLSEELIGPNIPSDLVIEFPYGTVKKEGIKLRDNVILKFSTKSLAKYFSNKNYFRTS